MRRDQPDLLDGHPQPFGRHAVGLGRRLKPAHRVGRQDQVERVDEAGILQLRPGDLLGRVGQRGQPQPGVAQPLERVGHLGMGGQPPHLGGDRLPVAVTRTAVNKQRVRDPAIRAQLHEFFRALPPDRFPALVALGEHVWVDNRDQRFTAGLEVLVAGLEQARRSPLPTGAREGPTTTTTTTTTATATTRGRQDAQQTTDGDTHTQGRVTR
jgi:hypothetical protein